MHSILRLLVVVLALAGVARAGNAADAGAADAPPTVVELYTSQGCSSCPPADANLSRLAARDDVIALGFHVDYWDYIGWKDPYARPAFGQRQRDYASLMGGRYVYTPQMVIQGTSEVVGSNGPAVERLIAEARRQPRVKLTLDYDKAKNSVTISIPDAQTMENHSVALVLYDDEHVTKIERGENGGRTLRYSHVVRELRHLADWHGQALTIPVKLSGMDMPATYACAVLLQSTETGRILGAAKLEFPKAAR